MRYTKLGRTGLDVSRIALGTWQFSGSWGDVDRGRAVGTIQQAFDGGINFFDTAYAYGFGKAEELLGEGLRQQLDTQRDDVVIVTKGGVRSTPDGNVRDSSPAFLRQGLNASLKALGVDYVDVFLLHWPDDETPMEAVAATVNDFVTEGKVRFLGASNFNVSQLEQLSSMTDLSVLQPGYNLLRRSIEDDVLPYCQDHEIGVFIYGVLAHGLLAGKYSTSSTFDESDWRSKSPVFEGEGFRKNVEMVRKLKEFASELGHSLTELVTAWALARPSVHCAIVGGKSADQVRDVLPAGDLILTEDDVLKIEGIAAEGAPIGGPSPEGGVSS